MKSAILAMGVVAPALLQAQSVRGVARETGLGAAVPGVVILLVDAGGGVAARALSNERGEYRVSAPNAGSYRLRTMRIGFRQVTSDVISLANGQDMTHDLELSGLRVLLDTIRVVDRSQCRMNRDSAQATFTVWEQIRTALTATQVSAGRSIAATIVGYERMLDRSFKRVQSQHSFVKSGFVRQPWASATPEVLRRTGYVTSESDDSVTYRAPGLEVLLSNEFLEDHCFRLARSKDTALLGVAFEPTRDRRRIPEISGTLWLNKASSELRRLEYKYVNLPSALGNNAGGDMEFIRMRNGMWAISRWNIRMPVSVMTARTSGMAVSARGAAGMIPPTRVIGLRVGGGELALAMSGEDTIWARPPLRLAGTVTDSTTGVPIAGARVALQGTELEDFSDNQGKFVIAGVLPGEYTLAARSPSLDSIGAVIHSDLTVTDSLTPIIVRLPSARELTATLCRKPEMAGALSREGVVLGRVEIRGDSLPPANVRVVAEWADTARKMTIKHEVRSNDRGAYRMCGVPLNNTLFLRAVTDAGQASVGQVLIAAGERFARLDLMVDRTAPFTASLAGFVLVDSTQAPIAEAEVSLPSLGKNTFTNQRGEFRINELPAGTHEVSVRRIGYGPLTANISFAPNETVERRVFLSKTVVLDTVAVSAQATIPEFEENKRLGIGQFLTRADLAKLESQTMGSIFGQMRGAQVTSDGMNPNRKYLTTSRVRSLTRGCYALVYVDRVLMYAGKEEEPLFDLNSISPDRIEAIEYYATPAGTPLKYATLNSQCGVLVIHTRRSP
ncbi:MAG: carboxypeptidase regulatory-like domain-containing protein [Gemmatimonadaceae bacterium]